MKNKWSWNKNRAGLVFQMPGHATIMIQEEPNQENPALRDAILELCSQFFNELEQSGKPADLRDSASNMPADGETTDLLQGEKSV